MTASDPTPTSELDAINQMLRAIGETPVSSLTEDMGIDVPNAKATLSEINKAVQLEGWQFNREYNYPLTRNIDGLIAIPRNALGINFYRTWSHDPVQRGLRVYDRLNHTYTFTQNLEVTLTVGLPFEELPEEARYYITYRACRKFQDTEVGSDDLHKYTKGDEQMARITLIQRHSDDLELNMLRDTPDFASIL